MGNILTIKDLDFTKFKHVFNVTVRNYEIDWQGIVHNGNYALYFEMARVNYFKEVGMRIDERNISGSVRIVIARNELDYFNSATFEDQLKIYTRVSAIRNSSFVSEGFMLHAEKNILIAKNVSTLVWTDPVTAKSTPVPNDFRKLVDQYEPGNADIHWPVSEV